MYWSHFLCPMKLQKDWPIKLLQFVHQKDYLGVYDDKIGLKTSLWFQTANRWKISKTIWKWGYPHLGDVQRYDHFRLLFRPLILIQWIHNTDHMYVLYATAQMWKHLFLCSFDAIKRLFNCALFTDGVHETLFVTRWRFLLKSCPRLISVTLTGTREKKWRERGKKSFRQIFTRQPADRREFIEYWRFQGFAYKDVKQALQNYSKRQFQSINDLAAAFFSHSYLFTTLLLAVVIYKHNAWMSVTTPLVF